MARARIPDEDGLSAVRSATASDEVDRPVLATAVRYSLQLLAERAEGNTVEVRVPPFGAVQCISGPRHTRGTPPNVVETDPRTWLALATGSTTWRAATDDALIHASGTRADLTDQLPLPELTRRRES
ncbi:MAG: sterol carrier family protein [Naasia sp.]